MPFWGLESLQFDNCLGMQVLKVVAVHKESLKADSLQQLHAMHNLASLLAPAEKLPVGIAPTLRDATLQKDANSIRDVRESLLSTRDYNKLTILHFARRI